MPFWKNIQIDLNLLGNGSKDRKTGAEELTGNNPRRSIANPGFKYSRCKDSV